MAKCTDLLLIIFITRALVGSHAVAMNKGGEAKLYECRRMSSNCTNTTIDIQNTLDEDGGIEKGSDGGRTTDDGGCVSDRE